MKISCVCGHAIVDSDRSSLKAHLVPDQDLYAILEAIDRAIELSGPSPQEKEEACMHVRRLLTRASKLSWQCAGCGRLYIDGHDDELQVFQPSANNGRRNALASRDSHDDLSSPPDA